MFTTPSDQPSKQSTDDKVGLEATPEEPPPTYSPPTEPVASGSDDPSSSQPRTYKTKPTNFLALSRDQESIGGEFVIDPAIRIPPSMLHPLGEGETEADRRNLLLRSRDGSVRADIWLLPTPPDTKHRRTTIALTSHHGSIHSLIHALDATPFAVTATAQHGSVKLGLPRSFTGMLLLSTRHGNVKLSEALLQHATQLSQLGDTRRYFVGDFGLLADEWEGDQIVVEGMHGSIQLRYTGEGEEQGKKGLFSRLFGL